MSHVLEFDWQERLIRVAVQGELSDAGATELYWFVQRFVGTHDVRGGILDLSPVASLSVSLNTVRQLAKLPALFPGPMVRVIVAPGALMFGMARLFQITRSEIHGDLYVVHTMEEAYKIHGYKTLHFERVEPDPIEGQGA